MKLFIVGCGAATLLSTCTVGQNLPLPPLPYDYNALEPWIDENTMRIHHLKHHQGYTTKLNAALSELRKDPDNKHLAKLGIDTLLKKDNLAKVPAKLRGAIQNNGGGYVNHDIFWNSMKKPSREGENLPRQGSTIESWLIRSFDSVPMWKQAFTEAAVSVFGSGWAWVVVDQDHLRVETTPNQNTPELPVVLALDVWEHAYYLKYQNNRPEYVENWFRLIDWDAAEARLVSFLNSQTKKDEL